MNQNLFSDAPIDETELIGYVEEEELDIEADIRFSRKPIDDATLLALEDPQIKRRLMSKIGSFLWANGFPSYLEDDIYGDFMQYMSGEDKLFQPELYMSKEFKEYNIIPYLSARLENYLKSVKNDEDRKRYTQLNLIDESNDDSDETSRVGCIGSNYIKAEFQEYDNVEADQDIAGMIQQAVYVKRESGYDILSFMAAQTEDGLDEVDIAERSGLTSERYKELLSMIRRDKVVFAPETGIECNAADQESVIDMVSQLIDGPFESLYTSKIRERVEEPLVEAIAQSAGTYRIAGMADIMMNIKRTASQFAKKSTCIEYLNTMFYTNGFYYVDEDGSRQKLSINKLYQKLEKTVPKRQILDLLFDILESNDKISRMYMLALAERVRTEREAKIFTVIKKLIKGFAPVFAGNSQYTVNDLVAMFNNNIALEAADLI